MSDLELAQVVADKTVERLSQFWIEKLNVLRDQWQEDLGRLRDDLTVKGLIQGEDCGIECPVRVRVTTKVGGATVLVVDDYIEIQKVLVQILDDAGITAVGATSSKEALEILSNSKNIDVVMADSVMPNNGLTLLEYVRKKYPTIEVVMTSGYAGGASKARDLGAFCFLTKPFSAEQALLLIERAVEHRRLKQGITGR